MSCLHGTPVSSNFKSVQRKTNLSSASFLIKSLLLFTTIIFLFTTLSFSQNSIVAENALPGNPASEWNIVGNADLSIQGFATNLSVNKGETVGFKIKTDASSYTINIYRIGYYQGNGARFIKSISVGKLQVQPNDLYDSETGKTDCSNWSVSTSWAVPTTAVSGLYLAKLTRSNGGSNHIIFIVRDDNGTSDLLFKTSDATWQAYNNYGGNSLYKGTLYGSGSSIPVTGYSHATKVSYNRPFNNRNGSRDWFTDAEFPMIRFLERNGYSVSYTTCENMAKDQTAILPGKRKILLSVGHDEYWSAGERAKYENARNAGVSLAFFSGNEMYWKSRWEDDYKTLVCYKEGKTGELVCNAKCDPLDSVWTGLWRGGCEYSLADGCKPENAVTGQMSWDEAVKAMEVPADYKANRFWRNTSIASLAAGQTAILSESTIGFEFDSEQSPETLPKGRFTMSKTGVIGKTHKLSLYKHNSGAWVFGAGTIQWSWGLDEVHTIGNGSSSLQYVADIRMQQATVNLFADMAVQPASLQSNLVNAAASTDVIAPKSIIITPNNSTFNIGSTATITGTSSDFGGSVGVVEVSVDGGITWRAAEGTSNWSYAWVPDRPTTFNIKVRSFDDSGNEETEVTGIAGITITVSPKPAPAECPCTVFLTTDQPQNFQNDKQSLETGMKFQASRNGYISGVRFYKSTAGTGNFSGHLWSRTGTLLASVDFIPSTQTGWQEMTFAKPVTISSGVTYVVSVFSASGDYNFTRPYFDKGSVSKGPLTALGNLMDGPNCVYVYTSSPAFPTQAYVPTNYWVDAVFKDFDPQYLPYVTKDPISVKSCAGAVVSFTAEGAGMPAPFIQWQYSINKNSWFDIPNGQAGSITVAAVDSNNGKWFRAVFTNTAGSVSSLAASLILNNINASIASQTNTSCKGTDGSITVKASGGIGPFLFSLNNGAFTSSPVFENLQNGNYDFAIKDSLGCLVSILSVPVNSMPPLSITLDAKTDASCIGNDGSLLLNASGGTPTYTYSFNSGNFQTSSSFTNLVPGIYSATVVDRKGCTATLPNIVIAQPVPLQLVLSVKTNANCNLSDGTIAVNAVGGMAPYAFSKDGINFQVSNIFNNLNIGTYTITLKDAKGCQASLPGILIENNSVLSLVLSSKTDATCGLSDGKFTVTGSCGVAPYRYMLNTGIYQTTGSFTNLSPGSYNVYIIDSKSTVATVWGIVIGENKTLALTASKIVNANCSNDDGSVTLNATGGKSPYQYKLADGAYKTGSTFSGISAGTYNFTVMDYNGCISIIPVTVTIAATTLDLSATSVQDASCAGSDGYITVSATGGGGGYLFNINGGVFGSSKTFKNLTEGTYVVSVQDSKGCIKSLGNIKVNRTSFVVSVTSVTGVSCKGNDGIISISTVGGTSGYLYSINGGKYDNANRVIENLSPGKYNVAVKDAMGCIAVINDVVVGTAPVLSATVSSTNACKNINNGSITTIVTGGEAPYQYSLSGAGYKNSNIFSSLSAGTYYVRVKDANGCLFTVSGIKITRLTTFCTGKGYDGFVKSSIKSNEGSFEKEITPVANISLFPNPSTGSFKLNMKGLNGSIATVVVIDALGKEVYRVQVAVRSDVQIVPISLDKIQKGLYFVKLSTNKLTISEKLVVY